MKVRLTVEQVHPDRQQYKPYAASLYPTDHLMVEVTVDDQFCILEETDEEGDLVQVLSPDGLAQIQDVLCDSIDAMHNKHLKSLIK